MRPSRYLCATFWSEMTARRGHLWNQNKTWFCFFLLPLIVWLHLASHLNVEAVTKVLCYRDGQNSWFIMCSCWIRNHPFSQLLRFIIVSIIWGWGYLLSSLLCLGVSLCHGYYVCLKWENNWRTYFTQIYIYIFQNKFWIRSDHNLILL